MGAWVGAALAGLSSLGGLFGKQKSTTDSTTTSTPTYDPTNQAFRDQLIKAFESNISSNNGFDKAYTDSGIQNIQRNAQTGFNSLGDVLSSRGIGRTTAGANVAAQGSYNAGNQLSQFLNNAPLVLDQRRQQILGAAGGYQSSLPVGSTQVAHSTTVGGPSSPGAGFVQGGAQGLAGWLGQLSAQSSLGNILKSIGNPSTSSNPGLGNV